MRTFKEKKKAIAFARKHIKKGNAISMDELLKSGQRPLVIKGSKERGYSMNFGEFL